ncbi:MAG: hypothetical protein NZ455_03590 [Bacteroidia bacterium]|nr:hypothetical protein [Bacteroidia bacterium]MDW8346373.1 hypothetical protein [Bacteroidia bacterium]
MRKGVFVTVLLLVLQSCIWFKPIVRSKKQNTQGIDISRQTSKRVVEVKPCTVSKVEVYSHLFCKSEVKYAKNYDDLNPMDKFMVNEGFNQRQMQGKLLLDVLVQNDNPVPLQLEKLRWQAVFENKLLDSGTTQIEQKVPHQSAHWVRIPIQYDGMKISQKNTMLAKTNTALMLHQFEHFQFFTRIFARPSYDSTDTVIRGICEDTIMKMLPLK